MLTGRGTTPGEHGCLGRHDSFRLACEDDVYAYVATEELAMLHGPSHCAEAAITSRCILVPAACVIKGYMSKSKSEETCCFEHGVLSKGLCKEVPGLLLWSSLS